MRSCIYILCLWIVVLGAGTRSWADTVCDAASGRSSADCRDIVNLLAQIQEHAAPLDGALSVTITDNGAFSAESTIDTGGNPGPRGRNLYEPVVVGQRDRPRLD